MRTVFFLGISLLVLIPVGAGPSVARAQPQAHEADVVVYGATPAGIIAAVTVAREGKSVLVIEPGWNLGGMITGGLCATDTGNRAAIAGYSREFFNRVRDYYVKKYGAKSDQVKDCSDGFRPEPHVAKNIFEQMLREAKINVLFNGRLLGVRKKNDQAGTTIIDVGIPGRLVLGKIWIDASYEGDLMAKVGVNYTVGRESREQYNESLAGVQAFSKFHQWPVKISAFEDKDKLLPFVQPGPLGKPGAGDKKVQAYNFRLCLTQRPELRLPWPKPKNYDPKRFELLARYLEKRPDVKFGQLCNPVKLPNGKTDTNNNGPISTDHIGANWDYPDGDDKARKRIFDDHVDYTQGFFYFLAHDPRVPKKLQDEVNTWGLSKGEHGDTAGWPPQLYIREARRMVGEYVMTQADIMDKRTKEDAVGLGSYNTDSHHVQRVATADGFALNEGDFQIRVPAYAIPYRCLVPRKGQCGNLLVPVCVSASHVAYGTIRMEPVFMILGQASGVAACLAIDDKHFVYEISIAKLQKKLRAQKAVLSPEEIKSAAPPRGLDPAKLPGINVDDTQATKTGTWVASASVGPFVGDSYLHDNNQEQGKRRIRFTPKLPAAGKYEVRLFYAAHANRASNALVVVHGADGEKAIRVNQRQALKNNQGFRLGVFDFSAGDQGWVEIRNDGADGFVIADAVQWLPVGKK